MKENTVGTLSVLIVWAVAIIVSVLWNINNTRQDSQAVIIDRARTYFSMVQTLRIWNDRHGGIYAPVTEDNQPNPFLDDPLRDVTTLEGLKLTKINPAYMTRQVAEIAMESEGVHFHLTSLRPFRPANAPDKWEEKALESFEGGSKEKFELVRTKEGPLYKYMAPLLTKKACLKCHAEQGYKEGDIRGGISLTFDATPMLASIAHQRNHLITLHILGFFFAVIVFTWMSRLTRKSEAIIEESRERYRELVEFTDAVHWELDFKTLRFNYISPQVEKLLGYPASSWIDFDFWADHLHPDDKKWAPAFYKDLITRGKYLTFTYRMIAMDGRVVWIRDIVNVEADESGKPVRHRGILLDVTELKEAEEETAHSLEEKEVLLRELHHRVKNNLAVITSLLSLQSSHMGSKSAEEILQESRNRIMSMALVHEQLFQTKDFSNISILNYLESLLMNIVSSYGPGKGMVIIERDIADISISIDVLIPLGLIVNELVTNSLKHAFGPGQKGLIKVSFTNPGANDYVITVSDDGKGMPEDLDVEKSDTLGLKLVNILAAQLEGTLEFESKEGTAFTIGFSYHG